MCVSFKYLFSGHPIQIQCAAFVSLCMCVWCLCVCCFAGLFLAVVTVAQSF